MIGKKDKAKAVALFKLIGVLRPFEFMITYVSLYPGQSTIRTVLMSLLPAVHGRHCNRVRGIPVLVG